MGRKIIRCLNRLINILVVSVCLLLLLYGGYGIWDSTQIRNQAGPEIFETYQPEQGVPSFEKLHQTNPDVFGWLKVEGTQIDYPLVQGEDNLKYLNTDVFGDFSLSGSLFLDARNNKDFSDFNSIIYGHLLEKDAMFGELARFEERIYFEKHPEGEIFYDGEWHGIAFFAFLHVDAYDKMIYNSDIMVEEEKQQYLTYLKKQAIQWRELSLTPEDHLLVLSTCTSESTNGRHVLLGRIAV